MQSKKVLIEKLDGTNYNYTDANLFEQKMYYIAEEQAGANTISTPGLIKKNKSFKTIQYPNGKYVWYVYVDEHRNFFLISDELRLARKYLAIPTKSDTTGPSNTYKILEPYLGLPSNKNSYNSM
jgi:hypothetical protein